ncbi:MAG: RNA methyltransferase [Rickettsiaceae bacterium]|nr:RNA methyltransferase [Rickettsiaceae bacterium]MDP4832547.1 RNA methyltransferase [Rickettsiaceae bacterium]MDP5020211.1 RNA methyltransferase [Rickettsiaceae bacterium]MDP5082893.1 RNA methyltransferase [Rickettsiaceae bacterium]
MLVSFPKIAIILVEPQMGENIGAVARAMKNFALSDLRLVSPRDGWPNTKAESMSVGAIDLIHKAQIYESIQDAIGDLEYVYAATAAPRDMNKNYILSRDISSDIPKIASLGIMFGRENCGLNNKEIAYANKIVTIDTDVSFSSLNIAHSVAVICYELFQGQKNLRIDLNNAQTLATKTELEYFYQHLFAELADRDFFKNADKKEQMSIKIRNLFAKIEDLSHAELQTLRGIVSVLSDKKG